ncbi:MAG: YraN family protein [Bowdeniella nasicola]|nr:YraN family protein [Bowdeniella nasicola]
MESTPQSGPRRNQVVGRYGEDTAVTYLERRGFRILERNWRCRDGEVDIVASDPDGTVCLIEVKTRTGRAFGHALEAITPRKLARMRTLAGRWRAEHGAGRGVRLDVIAIDLATGRPELTHLTGIDQ